MNPERLSQCALETFQRFSTPVGYLLKKTKSDIGKEAAALGPLGKFQNPENGMARGISLPQEKVAACATRIGQFLQLGVITPDELEIPIGRLSFSQTAIFGRFDRPFLAPLRSKNDAPYFKPILQTANYVR